MLTLAPEPRWVSPERPIVFRVLHFRPESDVLDALIQLWGEPLETLRGEDEVSRSESLATPEGSQEAPATAEGAVPPPGPQTPENSLVPPDAPPPTPQSSSASAGAADQR